MYDAINDALNDIFLDRRNQGKPLYLVLNNKARTRLATVLKCREDKAESYTCGITGSSLSKTGNPYTPHNERLYEWVRRGQSDRPPFTALLYTLSHAAELMVADGNIGSTNYYARLSEITRVDRGHLSQYGSETQKYWIHLSNWLGSANYIFGRPTAETINSNIYVSLALSQAILREADRRSFHQMFERYGFSGTDAPSADEISQYISAWLPSGRASQHLKAAWNREEWRPRICEVVLAELDDWVTGESEEGSETGAVPKRLSLAASIQPRFPSRFVSFSVGLETPLEREVELQDGSAPPKRLQLSNSTFGNFATVGSSMGFDIGPVLTRGIDCTTSGGGTKYSWKPRFVIPLKRSSAGPYWTEVTRVALGAEHLVLVRSDARFRLAVEQLLSEAATPGYTLATREILKGLPEGWVIYEKVRIVRQAVSGSEDLAPLCAISTIGSLEFSGGMQLGRNIWHRYAPLDVRINASSSVRLEAQDASKPGILPFAIADGVEGCAKLRIERADWPPGGAVTLKATAEPNSVRSSSMLVRSAQNPLPLDRAGRGLLAYSSICSAEELGTGGTTGKTRGLSSGAANASRGNEELLLAFQSFQGGGELEEPSPVMTEAAASAGRGVVTRLDINTSVAAVRLPCVERGCHRWRLPAFDASTSKYAVINAECQDCQITVMLPRSSKNPLSTAGSSNTTVRVATPPKSPSAPSSRTRPLHHELLLDALCFLGSGGWATLETIMAGRLDEPWMLHGIARDLSWLGHLDLLLSNGTGRLRRWCVPPPSLNFVAPGRAYFSGFRSQKMMRDLIELADKVGGEIVRARPEGQPGAFLLSGLDIRKAREVIARVADPHGRSVEILEGAADRIAAQAKNGGGLFSLVSPLSVGRPTDIQKYDLESGKWRRAEGFYTAGAYRYQMAGTTYVYRNNAGDFAQGPHEIIKLISARHEGIRLHCYDRANRTFQSRLGCEPIGLLSRALVASSCALPAVAAGLSTFPDVSPNVAAVVLECLYEGNMPI